MIDYSRKPELNKKNVIYKIVNLINNKIYVGQTKQTLSRRWKSHRKDIKCQNSDAFKRKSTYLCRAARKYGLENFKIEIIEQCEQHLLNEKEKFWIRELNTVAPNGYNLTFGGESFNFSRSAVQKMSESRKGKKLKVDYNKLRKDNSRPMKFIKDGITYTPDIPADFMKIHNLNPSQCHKVAKGKQIKTYGRNGKCYFTIPTHHKGWKIEYICHLELSNNGKKED